MMKQRNVQKPWKRLLSLLLALVLLTGQMGGAMSALAWTEGETGDTGSGEAVAAAASEDEDEGGASAPVLTLSAGGQISFEGANVTWSESSTSVSISDYTSSGFSATLTVDNGYSLSTLTVEVYDGEYDNFTSYAPLSDTDEGVTYNGTSGVLTISAGTISSVSGSPGSYINITAEATQDTTGGEAGGTGANYTVTLMLNGGTLTDSNSTTYTIGTNEATTSVTSGGSLTLPTTDDTGDIYITNSDYKFEGWYTDKDLTTAASANVTVTADVTYYAKWTKTVYFDANGGTFDGSDTKTVTGTGDETAPTPTATGYYLSGWTDESGNHYDADVTFAELSNGGTYFAQYSAITVTLDKYSNFSENITMESSGDYAVTLTPDEYYSVNTSSGSLFISNGSGTLTKDTHYTMEVDSESGVVTLTLTDTYISSLTGNVTLSVYAATTADKFTLSYTGYGYQMSNLSSSAPIDTDATYNTKYSETLVPVDSNYTLDGTATVTIGDEETTLTTATEVSDSAITLTEGTNSGTYVLTIPGNLITNNITVAVDTTLPSTNTYTVKTATISENAGTYTVTSVDDFTGYTTSSADTPTLTSDCVLIAPASAATGVIYGGNTYAGIIVGTVEGVTDGSAISDGTNTYYVLGDLEDSVTFTLTDSNNITSNSVTIYVNVDTTEPTVTWTKMVDDTDVEVTDTDYTSGGTYTLTVTDENLTYVKVTVEDESGSTVEKEWTADAANAVMLLALEEGDITIEFDNSSNSTKVVATLTINASAAQGTYTVAVATKDAAGNEDDGSTPTLTTVIATTAPVVAIGEPRASGTLQGDTAHYYANADNGDITYTLTITDTNFNPDSTEVTAVSLEVTKDGDEFTSYSLGTWNEDPTGVWTNTLTITGGAGANHDYDGVYVITLSATDEAKNESEEAAESAPLTIDTIEPEVAISPVISGEGNDSTIVCVDTSDYYANGEAVYTLTVTDANFDASKCDLVVTLDGDNTDYELGDWTQVDGTDTYTAELTLINGENAITGQEYAIGLNVGDKAGNRYGPDAATLTVDKDAPTLETSSFSYNEEALTKDADGNEVIGTSFVYSFTLQDTASGVDTSSVELVLVDVTITTEDVSYDTLYRQTIEVDSTAWNVNTATVTIINESNATLTDGHTYHMEVTASDNVGNPMDTAGESASVICDIVPPNATVSAPTISDAAGEAGYSVKAGAVSGTYYVPDEATITLTIEEENLALDSNGFPTTASLTIGNTTYTATDSDSLKTTYSFSGFEKNSEGKWIATITIPKGDEGDTYKVSLTLSADTVSPPNTPETTTSNTVTIIFDVTEPTITLTDDQSAAVDSTTWADTWAASRTLNVAISDNTDSGSGVGSGVKDNTSAGKTVLYYYITAASDTYSTDNIMVGTSQYGQSAYESVSINGAYVQVVPIDSSSLTLTLSAAADTDFKGTITFYAVDNVGNVNSTTTIDIALDDPPSVNVGTPYYDGVGALTQNDDDDKYYANDTVTYDLTAEDDQLDTITVTVTDPTQESIETIYEQTFTWNTSTEQWDAGSGTTGTVVTITPDDQSNTTSASWAATLTITAEEDVIADSYQVKIEATDSSNNADTGNDIVTSDILVIDATVPVAEISDPEFTSTSTTEGTTYYTNGEVTYTLTVTDANLGPDDITVQVNGVTIDELTNVNATASLSGWTQTDEGVYHTSLTITPISGTTIETSTYVVTLNTTDKAGNDAVGDESDELVIDVQAPVPTIDTPIGWSNSETEEGITTYYVGADGVVTYALTVTDANLNTSDITVTVGSTTVGAGDSATLTDDATTAALTDWTADNGTYTATLTITAGADVDTASYYVTLDATDKGTSHAQSSSAILIVDTVAPETEIDDPENTQSHEGEIYYSNQAVTYELTVVDSNIDASDATEEITVTVIDGNGAAHIIVPNAGAATLTSGDTAALTSWVQEGETYTATLTITPAQDVVSDSYKVAVTAKDKATNDADGDESETLILDTTDPVATISDPSYTSSSEETGDGTVNYSNQAVSYTLTVVDANIDTTGITVKVNGSTSLPSNAALTAWSETVANGISTWTATLTLAANANVDTSSYVVTLEAQDKAANTDDDETDTLIIDTVAPTVTYTAYSGNAYDSDYYANVTSKVTNSGDGNYYVFTASSDTTLQVTVTVNDQNIDMTGKQVTVSRYSSLADAESQTGGTVDYVPSDWATTDGGQTWTQTITIPASAQEGYYVLTLTAEDKAANSYATNSVGTNTGATENVLVNDTTAPTVSAAVANNTDTGSYGGKTVYYTTAAGNLAVTFTIEDNNDLLTGNSSYSFTLYQYDSANANTTSVVSIPTGASYFTGWSGSATSKNGTYTLDRSALGLSDGIYAVELTVTDQAGNETVYRSDYLVIDTTAPTGGIQAGGSGFSTFWQNLLSTITFGLYSNDGISYTMTWDDNSDSFLNSTEGVQSVQYAVYSLDSGADAYTTAAALAAATDVSWQNVDRVSADTASASVGNDEKFVIYLRIEDMAGNVTYISSDGLITEDDPSQFNSSDTTNPEILVTVANENGSYSGVHDSSVSLGVQITEYPNTTFSGIDQSTVAYSVTDGYGGNVSLSTADGSAMVFSTNSDGLHGSGTQTVVVSVPSGYESDQVYLTATVTDNAGNPKTVTYEALNIDNRTPTATVTYDNNTSYNDFYFNSPRVATIVIQEMNFDSSNTQVTTEGGLSGWTTAGSGSETTNTATVTYNQDGYYTIAIQSTDQAGHTMYDSDVVYEGVATQSFTIDMTAPTVSVSFTDAEGNPVASGGYANSTVTATITVVEHNFDASSATSGIRITRDGETYTPSITWSNSGDVHTAVITFTEEEGAYYTFDISFVDLANNQSQTFTTQSFYVDTVAPSIVVNNIHNNSANNAATIAPVITITDKYYDADSVTVTLTGEVSGVIANAYTVTEVEGGQQFTFNNIEEDDIYTITVTVTDLAGNVIETMYVSDSDENTDELMFSVNRYGSTYRVDEYTAALLEEYYTSSIDQDLVIEVINVDTIEEFVITASRGLLRSWDLTEGEDYTIEEEAITGGYRYTITAFREVFEEDGAYSISIYTEDAAGNTSTNNTAIDDRAIQLDFYLDSEGPIIVLNNLDKNGRYNYNSYDQASVIVTDATLDEITVEIIYQDGTGTKTYTWGEEEIYAEDFTGTFEAALDGEKAIAESTSQILIRVTAIDKAGNAVYGPVDEDTGAQDTNYSFTVSTNPFVRFFANKPLFYGTIAGVAVVAAGAIIIPIAIRRRGNGGTKSAVGAKGKDEEKAEKK
ncbi:MAG: InlB B-repeat-containing protein [Oscillospiraceae bacterium]|nr:InlB B-repeat-containing protein [Oscillospiraceae bacterium]